MEAGNQRVDKRRLARLLVDSGAVRFGEFTTKSGRISPYFVNLGEIYRGAQIAELAEHFAQGVAEHFADERPDCLFGPAYKAIPLAVTAAIGASRLLRRPFTYSFNRKEAKRHGESGVLVGRTPHGADRVLIVDDVVTDGGAKREAVELLRAHSSARVVGLLVAVDRMERGTGRLNALAELETEFGFKTRALIDIKELVEMVPVSADHQAAVRSHLARYRASDSS
jgi:orotate phosphoribosyltransferase